MADISKIKLPSGNEYDIKDATAREMISGGVSFIIAWNGSSTPDATKIPAGVVVTYNDTEYTGTLDADDAVAGAFYLVASSTTPSGHSLDIYDEYVPVGTVGSKTWEKIGDTQLDLSDVVTDVTLSKSTDTVIGSDSTFTITQPTIQLATDSSSGTGKVQVATGITSAVASTGVTLVSTNPITPTVPGTVPYVSDATATKAKATASGAGVAWNSKDQKTALTGVKVTTQPTVTLTANETTGTGRLKYVEDVTSGSVTPTSVHLSASASGGAVGASGDSVTAITGLGTASTSSVVGGLSTAKLATTTVTGVSGSTAITPVESRTSQTTADGTVTSSSTNTDILMGVSVTDEVLSIGAATLDTQTTYSAGAPRASLSVPTAASSATTVATGGTTSSGSGATVATGASGTVDAVTGYASPTTDTVLGTASTFSVTNPTITMSTSGDTGPEVVGSIGSLTVTPTYKYMSGSASGTAVGANGTANVIGASSTFSVTQPTVTLSTGSTGDIDVVTGVTKKDMYGTADTSVTVTPTTTYIKGSASGANTAWNSKDQVTVLTNSTDVSVTKGNE